MTREAESKWLVGALSKRRFGELLRLRGDIPIDLRHTAKAYKPETRADLIFQIEQARDNYRREKALKGCDA